MLAVDDAVRPVMNLAKVVDTEPGQFGREMAPLGQMVEGGDGHLDLGQQVVRPPWPVVEFNKTVQFQLRIEFSG